MSYRCFALLAVMLWLSTALPANARPVAQATRDRVTIVVMDQSGSMRFDLNQRRPPTKASDPLGLRCSAGRLLADLASPSDWLGLVKLESRDQEDDITAAVLLEPIAMGTAAAREQYKAQLNCDAARNNTPIGDALRKAFESLSDMAETRGADTFDGRVLLLTDGEPAPKGAEQIKQIDELLPKFAAQNWAISTVGLKLRANNQRRSIDLLQKIAGKTAGKSYGDIDQPLRLQHIFVEFFAEQTGRSLHPGKAESVRPNAEQVVNVADYADRIDVLVAKDNPSAAIRLLRPDGSEVNATGAGVELFSNTDPFYAAFSIVDPAEGSWSIRTDQIATLAVNVLVESHLKIRLDHTSQRRASNQPLELSARFYTVASDGQDVPTTVLNADVSAEVMIGGQAATVALNDTGAAPDQAANDGVYTGRYTVSTSPTSSDPISASVGITGRTGEATFTDNASLQLAPLPTIDLGEAGDALRLAPGSPIDVPLYLRLGDRLADPTGWNVRVLQPVANETRRVDVRAQGDHFIATLLRQPDDVQAYEFQVELLGTDQNEGLSLPLQPMTVQVRFQPTLKLFDVPTQIMPVGQPLTMSAALLRSFNTPTPISAPLQLNVQLNDNPAQPIGDVADDGRGMFTYRYQPTQPGRYRFTLLPPINQSIDPIVADVEVRAVPTIRWNDQALAGETLKARTVHWAWLDTLRSVPVLKWLALPLGAYRSETVQLTGDLLQGDQPYSQSLSLQVHEPNGAIVASDTFTTTVATSWMLPAGEYILSADFPGAFADNVPCCATTIPLTVESVTPPLGATLTALSVLSAELFGLLVAALLLHWASRPHVRQGDKLVFLTSGQSKTLDLKDAQGWSLLRPHRVDVTRQLKQRLPTIVRSKQPSWFVYKTRAGVELNGRMISTAESGTQIGDLTVRYVPKRTPGTRKPGGKPPRTSRPTRPGSPIRRAKPGLWQRLFGKDQPRSRTQSRSSSKSRRHS